MYAIAKDMKSPASQRISEAVSAFRRFSHGLHVQARLVDANASDRVFSAHRHEVTAVCEGHDHASLIDSFKAALRDVCAATFQSSLDLVSDSARVLRELFLLSIRFWSVCATCIQSCTLRDSEISPAQKRSALKYCACMLELCVHGTSSSVAAKDFQSQIKLLRLTTFIPRNAFARSVLDYLHLYGAACAARAARDVDVALADPALAAAAVAGMEVDDGHEDEALGDEDDVDAAGDE